MSTFSFVRDSNEDALFRTEVQNWLEKNLPNKLRGWSTRPPPELIRPWHKKLFEKGWIAPHWPTEFGGSDMALNQRLIVQEE